MNASLCSSSSEVTSSCFEGARCNNMVFRGVKPFVRVGCITKKDKIQVSNRDARKMVISSHLIPGHLESKKRKLEGTAWKLDVVRTLLIDNYDSYTYNIYQELSVINGLPPIVVRNDDWTWKDICHYLYEENAFDNIVISPGPGSPTCPADIGICLQLLLECRDIPILGVCLGHQALGYVHGAQIVHASEPVHGRLSEVEHNGCRLFHGIPSGRNSGFKVVRYHSLVIDADSLPKELIPIAWTTSFDTLSFLHTPESEFIPDVYKSQISQKTSVNYLSSKIGNGSSWSSCHSEGIQTRRVLMGIRHSTRPHYGVQFHPESVATSHGRQIFKNFKEMTVDYWLRSRPSFLNERKVHHTASCFRLADMKLIGSRNIFDQYFSTRTVLATGRNILKDEIYIRIRCLTHLNGMVAILLGVPFMAEPVKLNLIVDGRKTTCHSLPTSITLHCIIVHCLQLLVTSLWVPHAGLLFREIRRSTALVNNTEERSCSDLQNIVNISHSRIRKFLKLEWRKFDCLASQIGGAENIFCELFGHLKAENTFWLDSSSIEKRRARFSFMGGKGGSLWKQLTFRLSDQSDPKAGGYLSIEDALGSTRSTFLEDGFLDFLDKELLSYCHEEKDYEGLPFDFYGGYIGYIGYSLKVECGMPSNRHKSRTPDACFFFADNVIVMDHWNNDVYIMSINEGTTDTSSWLDDTEQKLLSLKHLSAKKVKEQTSQHVAFSQSKAGFLADKSREQYMKDVEKCLKFIKDGESYELCFTTQMRKAIGQIDLLGLYLDLRQENPAPYAAWLNFSKENLCICCSSPERFLRLDRYGVLEAKPIKGTISRGATQEEDVLLKMQLQHSEKDQAENLMIVDLLRNDLGRVCEPGSVHVPHLMEVESYATVHTMVSTIRGEKCANVSPIACVRAAFPGGSMTGAPKLRSMELLDSLESCSRGIYSGCIGYFSYNQTFDLNIVIRTLVIHEGEASIGAGGAIVALSNPEQEYEEMILKTRAPIKAVMNYQNGSASSH